MKSHLLPYLLLILCCSACFEHDDYKVIPNQSNNNPPAGNYIENAFQPYVESFYYEMELRGTNLRNRPLRIVFVDQFSMVQGNYCAYAYYNTSGLIEVLNTNNCWHSRTDIEKENLIYHELGHSLLGRSHEVMKFPNESYSSLMCTNVCSNYRVYHEYQPIQRNFYLDELLQTNMTTPPWAEEKFYTATWATDDINSQSIDTWQQETIDNDPLETPYTYFIEEENTTSSPYSLGITATGDNTTAAYGYWYKDFDVPEFSLCSNLKIHGDIITKGLDSGFVAIVVDLYDGANKRFGRYFELINSYTPGPTVYDDQIVTPTCIPLETERVRVLFYLSSETQASVYFDDLTIELHE